MCEHNEWDVLQIIPSTGEFLLSCNECHEYGVLSDVTDDELFLAKSGQLVIPDDELRINVIRLPE